VTQHPASSRISESLDRIGEAMVGVAAERKLRDERDAELRELDRDGVFVNPEDRRRLQEALD
jgi:hypothetical protein